MFLGLFSLVAVTFGHVGVHDPTLHVRDGSFVRKEPRHKGAEKLLQNAARRLCIVPAPALVPRPALVRPPPLPLSNLPNDIYKLPTVHSQKIVRRVKAVRITEETTKMIYCMKEGQDQQVDIRRRENGGWKERIAPGR